jgi:hypothetical protein
MEEVQRVIPQPENTDLHNLDFLNHMDLQLVQRT